MRTAGVPPVLAAAGLTKHFGGTAALAGVDFDILPGEVHALVGENGAGKSTLIKLWAGVLRPDAGQLLLDGIPAAFTTPRRC